MRLAGELGLLGELEVHVAEQLDLAPRRGGQLPLADHRGALARRQPPPQAARAGAQREGRRRGE